jgi:hypothetical protein
MSDSEMSDDAKMQQCMEEDAIKAVVNWIVDEKLRPLAAGRALRSQRTLVVDGEEWNMSWRENTGGAVGGYDVCYRGIMWVDFVDKLVTAARPVLVKSVRINASFDGVLIDWDFPPRK